MTHRPTQYEGFREKLFWILIAAIVTAVFAQLAMTYGLKIDMEVMKAKDKEKEYIQDTIREIARRTQNFAIQNNKILKSKADDSTNNIQHKILIRKIDDIRFELNRQTKFQHGYTNNSFPLKEDSFINSKSQNR